MRRKRTSIIDYLDCLRYFIRHNNRNGIIFEADLFNEIHEIENGNKVWQTEKVYKEHDKELTKQVCEKIREMAFNSKVICDKQGSEYNKMHKIYAIYDYELDQIEKGGENETTNKE